eukprot:5694642-Prymnesium_polylepis.1
MLKSYKSAYLPVLEAQGLARVFTAMLQSQTASDKAAALCVFDDVVEHCSSGSPPRDSSPRRRDCGAPNPLI